jgi:hypothetical protein
MADNDPGRERAKVLLELGRKISALHRCEEALTDRIADEEDPDTKSRLDHQLSETVAERVLCEARHSQIDSDGGFSNPGEGAEDALLEAIRRADRLIATSAAAGALMAAFHGLVEAYPGASTSA